MQQTLLEPPSREPAGMELAVLRWTPDEHRDHGSYSCGCNQSWIVLQPEISSKPNYGTCCHPLRALSHSLTLSLSLYVAETNIMLQQQFSSRLKLEWNAVKISKP